MVTGQVLPKARLLRFVVGPGGEVVPDVRARLPGRGIWVLSARAELLRAIRKSAFSRHAEGPVRVPENLVEDVESLLARQLCDRLGLAARVGEVAVGYTKAEQWAVSGRASGLLIARDAPAGQVSRAERLARDTGLGLSALLTGAEMGLALGRESMVHAGLGAGRLAQRFHEEAQRLAGFRSAEAGGAVADGASAAHPAH